MPLQRALAASIVFLLAALLPLATRAQPSGPVRATLHTGTVRWTTAPGTSVRVTLSHAAGVRATITVTSDARGAVTATLPAGVPDEATLRPGDEIALHAQGRAPVTRTVPALLTAIDPVARAIVGTAPVSATLLARAFDDAGSTVVSQTVTAGPSGSYSLTLPIEAEVGPGLWGTVDLITLDGDTFTARWDVLTASVTLYGAAIQGSATLGTAVTASLGTEFGIKGRTDVSGTLVLREPTYSLAFRSDTLTPTVESGDFVTVTDGAGTVIGGPVPGLTVRVDGDADRVAGLSPPSARLRVSAGDGSPSDEVVLARSDTVGNYSADFAGLVDLTPATRVVTTLFEDFVYYNAVGRQVQVRAALNRNTLVGSAPGGTSVLATLRGGDRSGKLLGGARGAADANGDFFVELLDDEDEPIYPAFGDRLIVVVGNGPAADILLPNVSAAVDTEADVVTGLAPPRSPVRVTVDAPGAPTVDTVADGAGRFRADYTGRHDLDSGAHGRAEVTRPDGHTVSVAWAAPRVDVALEEAVIGGVGPIGQPVALTLTRGGYVLGRAQGVVGRGAAGHGPSWSMVLRDEDGVATPVLPDDRLGVALSDWSLDLTVPQLAIEANAAADFVTGIAPAGQALVLTVGRADDGATLDAAADDDGTYTVDLSSAWNLLPADEVSLEAVLADGQARVAVASAAQGLRVGLHTGEVNGYALPGSSITALLTASDGGTRADVNAAADSIGRFELLLREPAGTVALPAPGDKLTVTYSTTDITMTIPVLNVDLDLDADRVTGDATPGGHVVVSVTPPFGHPGSRPSMRAQPTKLGRYEIDFTDVSDLTAGTRLAASHHGPAGHAAWLDLTVPTIHVQRGGNLVSGAVSPAAAVTVTLTRDESQIARVSLPAGADGAVEALLLAPDGQTPARIETGDVAQVVWSDGTGPAWPATGVISHTVLTITGTIDAPTRTVAGMAPPDEQLKLILSGLDVAGGNLIVSALSDADGRFGRTVPGGAESGPLPAGAAAEASVLDERGYRSFARLVVPYLELAMGEREVRGRAAPLAALTLSLEAGDTRLGRAAAESDTHGWFTAAISPTDGLPAEIAAGHRLALLEPGGSETALEVPPLAITLDTDAHLVHGTGPPDTGLTLRLFPEGRAAVPIEVGTDGAGTWSIDDSDLPPGATYTIADLVRAEARLKVDNGHLITAAAGPPVVPTTTPTASATPTGTPSPTATATPTATSTAGPTRTATSTPSASPTPTPQAVIYAPIVVKDHALRRR